MLTGNKIEFCKRIADLFDDKEGAMRMLLENEKQVSEDLYAEQKEAWEKRQRNKVPSPLIILKCRLDESGIIPIQSGGKDQAARMDFSYHGKYM